MPDVTKIRPRFGEALVSDWRRYRSRTGNSLGVSLDEVATRRGGYELYRALYDSNDVVKACIVLKASAIAGTGYALDPGNPNDPAAVAAAEALTDDLTRLPGSFDGLLVELTTTALLFGNALAEITVDLTDRERVRLNSLRGINPTGCDYLEDEVGRAVGVTQQKVTGGTVTVPMEKLVHLTHGSLHGDNYGTSDLKCCWRLAWHRENFLQWQANFMERLSDPAVIAKVPPGTQEAQCNSILSALDRISPKTSLLVPDSMTVELLESSRDPRAVFIAVLDALDLRIARSLLMPDRLGFAGGPIEGGSYSLAGIQGRMWQLAVEQERRNLTATIQEQLIARLFELGGWRGVAVPQFRLLPMNEEDRQATITTWNALVLSGAVNPGPRDEEHIRSLLGFPTSEGA